MNLLKPKFLSSHLSRQTHPSKFHTNSHLTQLLQLSQNSTSVSSIHPTILKSGFSNHTIATNHLLNAYTRLHMIEHARRVFDEMPHPNVVSWTSLMSGYINTGRPQAALRLFETMPRARTPPNSFTFATAVNACSFLSELQTGRKIHASVEVLGLTDDLVVCTSLIDMYGKCNEVAEARKVFDGMVCRNVVSWTSMMVAYVQNAMGEDALLLFREFTRRMSPNHFILASVISACASLGRLGTGRVTHGAVIRRGYDGNDVVGSSLVDMYAKCGCIAYSDKVFRLIKNPCVIPFTSMIVGAAKYGQGRLSLELFEEMLRRGIKPNDVTFVGVLHACSHSGLVEIGLEHLNSMYTKHGIKPDAKHYICAVDMLGRTGRVVEAYDLAKTVVADSREAALLWGSLLSASRSHGRVDITVEAGQKLIELNQQVAGAYVTMSNTYATLGKWDDAYRMRSEMKQHGIRKEPGCSWVEIKDATYVFYAGGDLKSSCPQGTAIVNVLKELELRMKERGYVSGTKGLVFVDVEEEAEEIMVGLHSEKLALAFCLIYVSRGVTIRVMKNLRMCWNCHEAFKIISAIVERDIIVRDLNRFHHFRDGLCNCNDFW